MITEELVISAQKKWAEAIVIIGKHCQDDREMLEKITKTLICELYAFEKRVVLFKPTKVSRIQFRHDIESAISYFIGGNEKYPEDTGFALMPWTKVRFENSKMILEGDKAIATGNYYFTDGNGEETKVEYTFGYVQCPDKKVKIELHHSSVPYNNSVVA